MKQTKEENQDDIQELLKEYDQNPYDTTHKTPEDVMRIFYQFDINILPVVSSRNILIGIITREKITNELSDIARNSSINIDDFIVKIAKKMTLDEILPFVADKNEFVSINIFAEVQKKWSRLELLSACENQKLNTKKNVTEEIDQQKEKQTMEWMIYSILEHIPRPLYAMNVNGKTIFYNSYFEDFYLETMKSTQVNVELLEKTLNDNKLNDFHFKDNKKKDIYFFNKELKMYYEKVPMHSNGKLLGYLVYCGKSNVVNNKKTKTKAKKQSLKDQLVAYERQIITDSLQNNDSNLDKVAKELKLTKVSLVNKLKKHHIKIKK